MCLCTCDLCAPAAPSQDSQFLQTVTVYQGPRLTCMHHETTSVFVLGKLCLCTLQFKSFKEDCVRQTQCTSLTASGLILTVMKRRSSAPANSPPNLSQESSGFTKSRASQRALGDTPGTPESHAQRLASAGIGEFANSKSLKTSRSRAHEEEGLSAEELEMQPLWQQNGHLEFAGWPRSCLCCQVIADKNHVALCSAVGLLPNMQVCDVSIRALGYISVCQAIAGNSRRFMLLGEAVLPVYFISFVYTCHHCLVNPILGNVNPSFPMMHIPPVHNSGSHSSSR